MNPTIAIADIHGYLDKLERMLRHHVKSGDHVIFLGDYIDRGPDSKKVIDRLLRFKVEHDGPVTFLRGNHEDMFLKANVDGSSHWHSIWMKNGGMLTLMSYPHSSGMYGAIHVDIPEEHTVFMEECEWFLENGEYVFVHAGADKTRPIRPQLFVGNDNLIWIREHLAGRLEFPHWEKTVVCGHTPVGPIIKDKLIMLDAGIFKGNPLYAMRFPERQLVYV
jgi:serine/threonine protein phosphatase 1